MATVCANCIHFHNREDGPRTGIWYNQFCKVSPREKTVDPVSGKTGYKGVNDFGQEYLTDEPYRNCRDINKGNCPRFEAKSGTEWPTEI